MNNVNWIVFGHSLLAEGAYWARQCLFQANMAVWNFSPVVLDLHDHHINYMGWGIEWFSPSLNRFPHIWILIFMKVCIFRHESLSGYPREHRLCDVGLVIAGISCFFEVTILTVSDLSLPLIEMLESSVRPFKLLFLKNGWAVVLKPMNDFLHLFIVAIFPGVSFWHDL